MFPRLNRRIVTLVAVLAPLAGLFIYVVLRSGPLAPIPVVLRDVESRSISPALFGIGTIEARYTYKIGPTIAGRVKSVIVQVGDLVEAGQLLGEMDIVDFDARIASLDASLKRSEASALAAEAQVQDATARSAYAEAQAARYEQLWEARATTEVSIEAKRQDVQVTRAVLAAARANLQAARQEQTRIAADRDGVIQQRSNLKFSAPVAGLVVLRDAEPGTTVVAGQAVVTIIDPASLWINARFDQRRSLGLRASLPARIALRSQAGPGLPGHVLRIEPLADSITEETLAKIVFDQRPDPLPPLGELAEVTVMLPGLPSANVVPEASLQRVDGRLGVWTIQKEELRFVPVQPGLTDLDGTVQILDGLKKGDRIVVYSERSLGAFSRIQAFERIPGVSP